jgi:hypothetical protein
MMCELQCPLIDNLQEELQQLHDMQRGRDRAVASGRYDVAVAAQVPKALEIIAKTKEHARLPLKCILINC